MLGVFPLPGEGLEEGPPAARSLILDGLYDPGNVGTLMRVRPKLRRYIL